MYLQRRSKRWQPWKARMGAVCPAGAIFFGHWCIALTIRTAKRRRQQLRQDLQVLADHQRNKMPHFLDDHWEQARRYRRQKGMGKHRRGANSASGMRRLRRLGKNHDGIRSAATRPHSMQIYQAIKYLSCDVADFLEKSPQ